MSVQEPCGECNGREVCPVCGGDDPDCAECQGSGDCAACREDGSAEAAHVAATAAWEAAPNSETRGALNAAAVKAGHACADCGMIPGVCGHGKAVTSVVAEETRDVERDLTRMHKGAA